MLDLPALPLHEAAPVMLVLLGAVVLAPTLARWTRLPDVVVLVLLGVLVGPAGTGLLARDGAVELLGGAGLLVLMFLAGLELDPDDVVERRRDALVLGSLTFALPLVLGVGVARALGLGWLPSVLLGSCWSSHTLLSYPQFRRAGTAGHPVVATTVGATIITDTAALAVLVVVVRLHQGSAGAAYWLGLLAGSAALVAATWRWLPRLARRYLAGPGQEPRLRLLFVLVAGFGVATLTGLLGVEPILGAFLAGLALSRSVPNGGALMERVELLGSSVFVPVFLLATGMLVDLRLLLDPEVLLLGAGFTLAATLGKLLAAAAAGRALGHGRTEVLAVFALSDAQAAATLAAVTVGQRVGLLDGRVVNAVVVVLLVTCVTSSLVAERVARRLPAATRARRLGACVVVPVANPATAQRLLHLAAGVAAADAGLVVPLVVVPSGSGPERLAARRALLATATAAAQAAGAEAHPVLRVDGSPQAGIAGVVAEQDASLLVLGWSGGVAPDGLAGVVDGVLDLATVPTLVLHDGDGDAASSRVLVLVPPDQGRAVRAPAVGLAARAARTLAAATGVPLAAVVAGDDAAARDVLAAALGSSPVVVAGQRAAGLAARVRPGDLVVVPAAAATPRAALRLLRALPAGTSVLVALAPAGSVPPEDVLRGSAVAELDGVEQAQGGDPVGHVGDLPA